MHIPQLFYKLAVRENIEVIIARLPERPPNTLHRDRQLQRLQGLREDTTRGSLTTKCICSGITTYPST